MQGEPQLERHDRSPGIVCGAGDGLLLEALKVLVVLTGHVAQLGDVGVGHAHAIGDQLLLHVLLRSRYPHALFACLSQISRRSMCADKHCQQLLGTIFLMRQKQFVG